MTIFGFLHGCDPMFQHKAHASCCATSPCLTF